VFATLRAVSSAFTGAPADAHPWTPFVLRALDGLGREYPYALMVLAREDAPVASPRHRHPVFHGCFDWHSSVHAHWCLARALRRGLDGPLAERALEVLASRITPAGVHGELAHLAAHAGFERPYGLAWVLQLAAELREWQTPAAFAMLDALAPLESLAAERLADWLPKLAGPIRVGEHGQSAFAMGLALDWARVAGDRARERLVAERARAFHLEDREAPIAYEPSAHDFLSPVLAAADLLRRVLDPEPFAAWLAAYLPELESPVARRWLTPVTPADRADGKLAHLDGLNLSRAWMLQGVARGLPGGDPRIATLEAAAAQHAEAGVTAAVESTHYAGTHWLGTFAVYLLSRRGLGG
jgi:hypothetical protein